MCQATPNFLNTTKSGVPLIHAEISDGNTNDFLIQFDLCGTWDLRCCCYLHGNKYFKLIGVEKLERRTAFRMLQVAIYIECCHQ